MKPKAYKWCAAFLLFILLYECTTAQNLSFDINKVCNKSTNCNPFQNNYSCAGGVLRATHGSPAFYLPATNPTKEIELQAEIEPNGIQVGEGFTLEYLFRAGIQYQVTIKHSGRPETGSVQYPNLIAALTNSPNRRDDGCGLGSLPNTSVYTSFSYTISKKVTTSSFTITPTTDIIFLWLRSSPVQVANAGLLIFSIEIKDFSVATPPPPNPVGYACNQAEVFDYCNINWSGPIDCRATRTITLACNVFNGLDPYIRKFSAPTIVLEPGFSADAGNANFFKALASNNACHQPLRVITPLPDTSKGNIPIPEPGHITIYPTIGNGHVTIQGSSESLTNVYIILYDQLGRTVYQRRNRNTGTIIELDLNTLSKGLYFLRVQKTNQVITKKIIIN